jgi:hypothetical protein
VEKIKKGAVALYGGMHTELCKANLAERGNLEHPGIVDIILRWSLSK